MKRILSILSIIAMLITMMAMVTLPATAEETELVNLFDLDTSQKGTISATTGGLSSNDNYYSTGYIAVEPGDTLYFGLNDAKLGYQLYIYADASTSSFKQIKSTACTIEESVSETSNRHWAILSYTIPDGYTQVRVTCRVTYADQYLLTKNQPFTNEERIAYFTSPVTNIYVDKALGYWQKDGTIKSSSAHHSSELIEVAAGDKIYFGPCNVSQGFQLYHWAGTENFDTYTIVRHGNAALAVTDRFPGNQVIYCYTAPSAGRIGLCNAPAYNNFYCITKNEELTLDVYKKFLNSINYAATTLYEEKPITSNIFSAVETQGYYQTDGTVKSSTSHYSGELISVKAGDVIYFGPVNLGQGFHLYDWAGTEGFPTPFKLAKADVQKYVIDTFPNGQAILAYEATQTGRVGLVNATAYNSFFVATKNERMTIENYYDYADMHSDTMGNYSIDTGRFNNVEVKESVLNGKSALFTGDSICAAAADDDFFNKYFYYNGQTEGANWGGWAGRIAMNYGLERIANNGVSGAALSNTRDRWYNTNSTSKKQGRIYWQITKEADYQYDYVILHGGVNDAWDSAPAGAISDSFDINDFDLSTYAGGLEATIYYATKYHPEAAIGYLINFEAPLKETGNIPNMGEIYFELGKQICEKWGIPYLDLYSILNAKTFDTTINVYTKDTIHPNAAGYNIIADYVGEWMETLQPYTEATDTEHEKTVIACVGDSLTKGEQSGDLLRLSYPAYLQEMLGDNYKVMNFGYGGAAVQPSASNTYKETVQYKKSLEADPDQVIIMLGANDAKAANWDTADHTGSCAKFKAALKALVEQYQSLPSKPTVYLATTPWSANATRQTIYNDGGMLDAIKSLATEMNLTLIDTYEPTKDQSALLAEGDETHFTPAGYELIAGTIYEGLTGETAPEVLTVTEKDTAVEETDETKPLIRNWKAYYETATAFRIETVEDVEIFGDLIAAGYTFAGKTVYLENDLDFAGIDFMPLGIISGDTPDTETYSYSFAGTFDGQNHVFSNVNIEFYYLGVGLFPVLDGATIKNFGLNGGRVAGHNIVGSITAYADHGSKLINIWSSADVYASIGSTASGVGGIASNMRQSGGQLINAAYYGTVSGVEYVSGLVAYSQNNVNTMRNLVFGGTIDLHSKHKGVTPFVRYKTADLVQDAEGYFMVDTAEQRSVYVDVTPVEFSAEAFTNGEFAAYMNAQSETPVWTMKYGYAVPFADENNAAPVAITKDSETFYTDYAGDPIGFSMEDGTYWYLNGVLTALADMPETLAAGTVLGVAVSKAGADFDGDSKITTADATMLLRFIDGHRDDGMNDTLADVNADGKVRIFDAVRLMQVIRDLPVA